MSKIFMYVNKLLVKVAGHKYTGFTVKTPFVNLSFAPAQNKTCSLSIRPLPVGGGFLLVSKRLFSYSELLVWFWSMGIGLNTRGMGKTSLVRSR